MEFSHIQKKLEKLIPFPIHLLHLPGNYCPA